MESSREGQGKGGKINGNGIVVYMVSERVQWSGSGSWCSQSLKCKMPPENKLPVPVLTDRLPMHRAASLQAYCIRSGEKNAFAAIKLTRLWWLCRWLSSEELRPVDATMKKLLPSNIDFYICTNTKLIQTGEIEMYLQCSKLHFAHVWCIQNGREC